MNIQARRDGLAHVLVDEQQLLHHEARGDGPDAAALHDIWRGERDHIFLKLGDMADKSLEVSMIRTSLQRRELGILGHLRSPYRCTAVVLMYNMSYGHVVS